MDRRYRLDAWSFVLFLDVPVFEDAVLLVPVAAEVSFAWEVPVLEAAEAILPVDEVLLIDILLVEAPPVDLLTADVLPPGVEVLPGEAFVPVDFLAAVLGAVLWSVPEVVAAKAAQPVGSANTRIAAKVRTHLV